MASESAYLLPELSPEYEFADPEQHACATTAPRVSAGRGIAGVVLRRAAVLGPLGVAFLIFALPYVNAWRFGRGSAVRAKVSEALSAAEEEDGHELNDQAVGMLGLPVTGEKSCASNEESFMGACFKKCSILTSGNYTYRFAPSGCCKHEAGSMKCILPSEVDVSLPIPGYKYFVDGGGNMPHLKGSCDVNEESYMGLCYKKCDLLTNDEYKFRITANTCCKKSPCWNPFNLKTRGIGCHGFGVGGGLPGHACPHGRT
jgi:hypothetical protein